MTWRAKWRKFLSFRLKVANYRPSTSNTQLFEFERLFSRALIEYFCAEWKDHNQHRFGHVFDPNYWVLIWLVLHKLYKRLLHNRIFCFLSLAWTSLQMQRVKENKRLLIKIDRFLFTQQWYGFRFMKMIMDSIFLAFDSVKGRGAKGEQRCLWTFQFCRSRNFKLPEKTKRNQIENNNKCFSCSNLNRTISGNKFKQTNFDLYFTRTLWRKNYAFFIPHLFVFGVMIDWLIFD